MATRSMIAATTEKGLIKAIYCHWDGYVSHNGKILFENYTYEDKVQKLLDLGDLSSLGEEPIDDPQGWDYTKEHDFTKCVSYKARGEKNVEARLYNNEEKLLEGAKNCGAEFVYLWKEGRWYVQEIPWWSDLEDKIRIEEEDEAPLF